MHTKGPWTRTAGKMRQVNNPSKLIESPNGEYIVMILDLHPFNRDDEIEANACLIAAAPELLEELDNLVGVIDILKKMVGERANGIDLTFAEQLIVKAKGLST